MRTTDCFVLTALLTLASPGAISAQEAEQLFLDWIVCLDDELLAQVNADANISTVSAESYSDGSSGSIEHNIPSGSPDAEQIAAGLESTASSFRESFPVSVERLESLGAAALERLETRLGAD